MSDATFTFNTELEAGLDPTLALERAEAALRAGDVGMHVAAFYLADIESRGAYTQLDCPTMRFLITRRLRRSPKTLANHLSVARKLQHLPLTSKAFEEGRLNRSQVRLLVTVATPETERAWIEWAMAHATNELEAQVRAREKGQLPTEPGRRRIHEPRTAVNPRLNPTEYELHRRARLKVEAMYGRRMSDRDYLMHLSRRVLMTRPDGTEPGWKEINDRHYMLHAWSPDGGATIVTTGEDGELVALDPLELTARLEPVPFASQQAAATCARELEFAALDPENHGPYVPEAERAPPTSERLRDEVLERDGFQCRICHSKKNVQVHHRVWRRFGGRTDRANLMVVCERCHSFIHARLFIVRGDPEGDVFVVDRQGRPFEPARAQAVRFAPAPEQEATAPSDPGVGVARPVSLDTLPAEIDGAWWERNSHLLAWNDRHGDLVLTAGSVVVDSREPIGDKAGAAAPAHAPEATCEAPVPAEPDGRADAVTAASEQASAFVAAPQGAAGEPVVAAEQAPGSAAAPQEAAGEAESEPAPAPVAALSWTTSEPAIEAEQVRASEVPGLVEPVSSDDLPVADAPAAVAPASSSIVTSAEDRSGGHPVRLADLVGQRVAREQLEVAIAAAQQRGEQLRHLVFTGLPGLGKTALARAVAIELGVPLVELPAPHVRSPETLVRALASIPRGGLIFLDEVHRLPDRAAEVLYEALDRGTLTLPVREGLRTRTIRLRLAPLTLVGATTDEDLLPRALLSRLRVHHLEPYAIEELATLIERAASGHRLTLTGEAAERLARASRETPRRALSLLESVRDEATVAGVTKIDEALVGRALDRAGVDPEGLDRVDRDYLHVLSQAHRPMGIRSIASRLHVSEAALRSIHEPHLIRRGFVVVTREGRVPGDRWRRLVALEDQRQAVSRAAHAPAG